jgi:REP element-mobilizing transposase RayT
LDFGRASAAASALHEAGKEGGVELHAWVLMPDHVHLLVSPGTAETLSRWVGRARASMTRAVRAVDPRAGCVWARGFHDHALRAEESVRGAARYLIHNPVRAGLVERAWDYSYWFVEWV